MLQAIRERHSVRAYTDQRIEGEIRLQLQEIIERCNQKSGLHIQLILDEPEGFNSRLAHYGRFSNVKNYIALVGQKSDRLDELCGYYGETIVLRAQQLGLNTCWVGLTYNQRRAKIEVLPKEKRVLVIAIGYGVDSGRPHSSKSAEKVGLKKENDCDWYRRGIEAALLAPTALNQQKFVFTLSGPRTVQAKALAGFYTKVDLGIAKLHFEIGAGKENFDWA